MKHPAHEPWRPDQPSTATGDYAMGGVIRGKRTAAKEGGDAFVPLPPEIRDSITIDGLTVQSPPMIRILPDGDAGHFEFRCYKEGREAARIMPPLRVFMGWDDRERDAYRVAEASMHRRASVPLDVQPIVLNDVQVRGLYSRPTETRDGKLYDVISEHPMATEFAISRFLVPHLAGYEGWALFVDCDVLAVADLAELFALADDRYAVMCVQHDYRPAEGTKMDAQVQTAYQRKNWSSVILWNCAHPAHRALTGLVDSVPGRYLHRFCWLRDHEIGALPAEWNALVTKDGSALPAGAPKLLHYTEGGPWFGDAFDVYPYADDWLREHAMLRAADHAGAAEVRGLWERAQGAGA